MSLNNKLISLFPERPEISADKIDDNLAASLFPEGSTRLAHMRRVSEMSTRIARQLKLPAEQADKLITAALFHDVGYSEKLKRTGFHPLDGAVFLAHLGVDEEIVETVLWHSSTIHDITYLPEIKAVYDKLTPRPENSFMLKIVSFSDFRSSPVGEAFSFGQRISELMERYGTESSQVATSKTMLGASQETLREYVDKIRKVHGLKLPWIFCDIDNTLVHPGTLLNETSRQAIHRYMDAGGKFSLVTGKHLISIMNYIKEGGLPGPHSGINGSVIYENDSIKPFGPVLHSVVELEDILMAEGIHYTSYCEDSIWTRCELTEAEIGRYKEVAEVLPRKGATPQDLPVFKILTFSHQSDRERCGFVRKLALKNDLGCVRTSKHFLELMPKGHGKHSAAMEMMRRAEWPDLFSIAIGDSENDMQMLGISGYSAAVSNAEPEVAAAADLHLPHCEENGVATLLDALVENAEAQDWQLPEQFLS